MIVQALKRHRALNEVRAVGAVFHVDTLTGRHLVACGFARAVASNEEWHGHYGRELRTEPLTDRPWPTVVACLNIWNDRPALERTIPSWLPLVDALVVADGPYRGVATEARSTDGLGEMLEALGERVPVHRLVPRVWANQNEKRTALLKCATEYYPGALLFIIDADEYVATDLDLHQAPEGDVGWVAVASPMYQRPYGQPRLIRARPDLQYQGRHHWLYAGDRLLVTHQYGGVGWEHRHVPLIIRNQRGMGHTSARHRAKQENHRVQVASEAEATTGQVSDAAQGARESLRITQTTTYDPGMVAFRLHTAINTTTPHASVFLRRGQDNPFAAPRQYDPALDPGAARAFLRDADVVHCHLDYTVPDGLGVKPKRLVIHHHGTMLRNHTAPFATLDRRACLRLVSNLELLSYGENLHWLPNPVSVARLRRLRSQVCQGNVNNPDFSSRAFRVSHSPSKRHLKGTADFLAVCESLRARGLNIEPVLIEGQPHSEALRLKATCDAAFDSFWLGIQCSGLEAAGMGLPVIAGDATVKERYEALLGGPVPYTYADDAHTLAAALERLATDAAWRAAEAARVSAYVETWHDDAAVALCYLNLLDEAIGWRAAKTLGPKTPKATEEKTA